VAAVVAVVFAWGAARPVLAQNLTVALRTNGSIMRPGDCLRLEALALDDISGPLAAQVTYRYDKPVLTKDKDGTETTTSQVVELRRPAGPAIDLLGRLQPLLVDDTFCFGQGGSPGRYDVEVAVLSGRTGPLLGTLRTCVVFDDADAVTASPSAGCGFLVRGLKRAEADGTLVFDADLPSSGFYRGAILRGGNVEAVLDSGVYKTGPNELTVLVPVFSRSSEGTVDLVVVEQFSRSSSTAARLPISMVR
jgi:hypothetical protein